VRDTYLRTVDIAIETIALPVVAANWMRPSSLEGWPVATLCGHLGAGSTATVLRYLDGEAPDPSAETVDALGYFTTAQALIDSDPAVAGWITSRAEKAASGGQAGVVEAAERAADLLRERLAGEPTDRAVTVFAGMAIGLDDYLVTRLVELCVHIDDLAAGLDMATPQLPEQAMSLVTHTLIDVARGRHGDVAVLRALTRTERAPRSISAL